VYCNCSLLADERLAISMKSIHRWKVHLVCYNSVADSMGHLRLAVVASQMYEIARNSKKIRSYSSSRSFKVTNLGANRKLISNFLLLINSNVGVFCTVFEILPLKATCRKILVLPTPPWFDALAWSDPFRILWRNFASWGYQMVKKSWR